MNASPGVPIDPAALQSTLQLMFPSAEITPAIVAQVAGAIANGTTPSAAGNAGVFSYYIAQATHTRRVGTNSSFVGKLPLVRFPLPASGNFDTNPVPTVATAIGVLLPEDRLIASVAMVAGLFGTEQAVTRIDLLTPARAPTASGARFGAFATYLCYAEDADTSPSWYILEGGTAPGVPRVLYPSQGMAQITNNQLAYQPTTFSKVTDFVSGALAMHGNEPSTLDIWVTDTSGQGPDANPSTPYVTVHVDYLKQAQPPPNDPLGLILQAAARLGIIGTALGTDAGFSEDVIATLEALTLNWITRPGS